MKKAIIAAQAIHLEQIPNIGPAMVKDFQLLEIFNPSQLAGRDPYMLYQQLCELTRSRHDPCVIDTLIAAVRFMEGAAPLPWWHYTAERKAYLETHPKLQSPLS